eukprot:scaffold305594_cov18-Prasinocladus_malaysianus.AAC.1
MTFAHLLITRLRPRANCIGSASLLSCKCHTLLSIKVCDPRCADHRNDNSPAEATIGATSNAGFEYEQHPDR